MKDYIKTLDEIKKMRIAGKLASDVLMMIRDYVKPGISTGELDRICHDYIVSKGAIPSPLNYRGFPKSICTSVNEEICHGIPSNTKKLKSGDIIEIETSKNQTPNSGWLKFVKTSRAKHEISKYLRKIED